MRDKTLAVDCPAREPDPVLLEQLTALAAGSTAPAVRPWWQRFTLKTGAAAVAGVLLISGATADAEHARPSPLTVTIVSSAPLAAPHRTSLHGAKAHGSAAVSPVISSRISGPMRHAWNRSQHPRKHQHARGVKHEKGNSNGGGSQNGQVDAQAAQVAQLAQLAGVPALAFFAAAPVTVGKSHAHRHARIQH